MSIAINIFAQYLSIIKLLYSQNFARQNFSAAPAPYFEYFLKLLQDGILGRKVDGVFTFDPNFIINAVINNPDNFMNDEFLEQLLTKLTNTGAGRMHFTTREDLQTHLLDPFPLDLDTDTVEHGYPVDHIYYNFYSMLDLIIEVLYEMVYSG